MPPLTIYCQSSEHRSHWILIRWRYQGLLLADWTLLKAAASSDQILPKFWTLLSLEPNSLMISRFAFGWLNTTEGQMPPLTNYCQSSEHRSRSLRISRFALGWLNTTEGRRLLWPNTAKVLDVTLVGSWFADGTVAGLIMIPAASPASHNIVTTTTARSTHTRTPGTLWWGALCLSLLQVLLRLQELDHLRGLQQTLKNKEIW